MCPGAGDVALSADTIGAGGHALPADAFGDDAAAAAIRLPGRPAQLGGGLVRRQKVVVLFELQGGLSDRGRHDGAGGHDDAVLVFGGVRLPSWLAAVADWVVRQQEGVVLCDIPGRLPRRSNHHGGHVLRLQSGLRHVASDVVERQEGVVLRRLRQGLPRKLAVRLQRGLSGLGDDLVLRQEGLLLPSRGSRLPDHHGAGDLRTIRLRRWVAERLATREDGLVLPTRGPWVSSHDDHAGVQLRVWRRGLADSMDS
mmetsp:Transcript_108937/g.347800  ORF Transcript_108937/g.347800 Transcript_108937/m.347800 type:complete len:255 (-) Transcript_108937:2563-3327(-)